MTDSVSTTNLQQSNEKKPTGSRFMSVLLVLFMGYILLSIPMMLLGMLVGFQVDDDMSSSTWVWWLIAIIYVGVTYLICKWVWRTYKKRAYEDYTQKIRKRDGWINIAFAAGLRVLVFVGSYSMIAIYGEDMSANDKALFEALGIDKLSDINVTALLVISIIIFLIHITFVAPFLEELIFRGMFKERVFRQHAFWLPLIISSIIFGMAHMGGNVIASLMYIGLGVIMYLAYNRRGNIKDSMMVHMINNGVASISIIVIIFTSL